jgi:ribonuclease P protein component
MGMAVGRKVGGAVRRNRVKRLLRTALRNLSEGWPGSVEVIVVVEPHPPATLEQYTRWLNEAVRSTASWPEHSP